MTHSLLDSARLGLLQNNPPTKKKCAILTAFDPYSFKGGIETYTCQLVALLQTQGISVDIYHTDLLPKSEKDDVAASPLHSFFLNRLYRLGQSFYWVDHLYDFVVSHAFFGFSYTPPRIPAFTVFHSTHAQYAEDNRELFSPEWSLEVRSLFGFGAERLSTIGKTVIAVSEGVAREAKDHYAAQDVRTVLTGVDRSIFFPRTHRGELRDKFGIPYDTFVGVFLARWDLDKALDVLEAVMQHTPEVFWLLVLGTGPQCFLKENAKVKILERIEQTEVAEALSLADFLFHPARYEGFGLAIVEALACGLPVIAAPVGVMRMIGQNQPFRALLLPSYAEGKDRVIAGALAAIARLRSDKELRQTLQEAGPALVKERFDHRRWQADFLSVLGVSD
jgi:glycosyltransferase involved in cell wall biosynthesis